MIKATKIHCLCIFMTAFRMWWVAEKGTKPLAKSWVRCGQNSDNEESQLLWKSVAQLAMLKVKHLHLNYPLMPVMMKMMMMRYKMKGIKKDFCLLLVLRTWC